MLYYFYIILYFILLYFYYIIVIDIDECTTLAPCHHTCTNNDGSYTCSCDAGFELNSDGLNCERELSHWVSYMDAYYDIAAYSWEIDSKCD